MTNTQTLFQNFLNTLAQEDIKNDSLETISTDLTHWESLNILSIEDFNKNQEELKQHLLALSEEDRSSGSMLVLVDELAHWNDYNIYTVDQFNHYDAQTTHYDLYNEVHDIKPRWIKYSEMTTEAIQSDIEKLVESLQSQADIEKANMEEYSRMVQKRKAENAYKPNLAFSGLKDLIQTEKA